MFEFTNIYSNSLVEAIGWALFHSVWQATLIAILLMIVLNFFKKYSAQSRYIISLLALVFVLIWSISSFIPAYNYATEKQEIKELADMNPNEVMEILKERLKEDSNSNLEKGSPINTKLLKFKAFMQRNFPVVFLLWILGVFIFILRLTGAMFYLHKLKNRFVVPVEAHISDSIDKFKNIFGIERAIDAFQSTLAKTPMVIGYIKPVILLPVSLLTGLSSKEIEAIIVHELAHIKRHDYLFNILQSVIETLFFYHPAVWLISKTIREERENSCDEIAVEITGDKISYIKALTASHELNINKHNTYEVAFSGNKGSFLQRVIKIKNFTTMKKSVTEGFIAAAIVFLGLILLSFSFDGQNLKKDNPETTNPEESVKTSDRKPERDRISERSNRDATIASLDSLNEELQSSMDDVQAFPVEMEQLMDLAYTYNDVEMANLIRESMELAKAEIHMDSIMAEVKIALEEAKIDEEIRLGLEEARLELIQEFGDSSTIALEALEVASATLEALDIDEIVSLALEQATIALESIDMKAIMEEAMIETKEALEEIDIDQIMKDAMEEVAEAQEAVTEMHEEMESMDLEFEQENTESDKSREGKNKKMEEKLMEFRKIK